MKKRRKELQGLLTAAVVLCLMTACAGRSDVGETQRSSENEAGQSEALGAEEADTEETQSQDPGTAETEEEDSSDQENSDAEASDAEGSQEKEAASQPKPFVPVEGLSEDYADLEKRCFAYKGQIFTLGESTLQDLIDGGIPFDEDELKNIGNNVNSNYETGRYSVEINDYVWLQFSFLNMTDDSISEAECLLCSVRWYTIYVPQPDYEDSMNEEITAQIADAQEEVCFSFPFTLTKEQLLENNGNATEIDEYNNVRYYADSEIYMGKSGYSFEFNKTTDQLEAVSISWLP